MKMNSCSKTAALLAVASLSFSAGLVSAQEASATATNEASTQTAQTAQTAPAPTPAPQLAYGVPQILQLAQAKVSDDTIIAYIRNSGNSYGLDADQIIYLQQQGLSTPVINAMLSQPRAGVLGYTAAAPAPVPTTASDAQPTSDYQPPSSTVTVGPPVTAIDPTAAAGYAAPYYPTYYYPYYPHPYYYPAYGYYGFYPAVSVSIGLGGGWRGGGYHGGFHGGGFRGGFRH